MTELMNSSTTYCMFVTLETEQVTSSRSMVSNIGQRYCVDPSLQHILVAEDNCSGPDKAGQLQM